jgi:hypothetical protein
MYTRDKKIQRKESCRGGRLLSTVSLSNLGDREPPVEGESNSGTSNSRERFNINSLTVCASV